MQETIGFTQKLEDEAIYILRETFAQFKNPIILFSGGKDSITLVYLSIKAFWPCPPPFALLHIDTGHNFSETISFRDELVKKLQLKLIVRSVENTIRDKNLKEERGPYASRNQLQTYTLLDAITELNIDACIGGARRDEERSRAKERFFSFRDQFGKWDVEHQRPEVFDLLNGRIHKGEHIRVFPLSNWTEQDVWQYIKREKIELPELYYAHERQVFERDGLIWSADPLVFRSEHEKVLLKTIRFRTVGDMTCTAACESSAKTVDEVIREISTSLLSERGARIDDKRSDAAMEKRKTEGYF